MILTILSLTCLIAGIVILIIYHILDFYEEWLSLIGLIFLLSGSLLTIIFTTVIIANNSSVQRTKTKLWYQETVESLTIDYTYIQTLQDDKAKSVAVVNYNTKVKEFKIEILTRQECLNNPWISWLNCYEYQNMDVNTVNYIK